MKYGIIGTGYSFRAHVCTLKLIPEAELVALAEYNKDRIPEALEFAGQHVEAYTDYNELLKRIDIDIVIVATPNNTHANIAIDVLSAGKNALCEKPMAITLEDCNRMIEAEKKSKGKLFIGLECRYNYFYSEIKKIIDSGQLGKVHYISCKEYRGFFQAGTDYWRTSSKATGGALLEKNVHHFDLFNWYTDSKIETVSGIGGNAFNGNSSLNDEMMVIAEYKNGIKLNLNVCLYAPWTSHSDSHQEFGFVGDKGMLEAFLDSRKLFITETATGTKTERTLALPEIVEKYKDIKGYRPDYDSWFYLLYEEHLGIINNMQGEDGLVVTSKEGKAAVEAALSAEKAVQQKTTLKLNTK